MSKQSASLGTRLGDLAASFLPDDTQVLLAEVGSEVYDFLDGFLHEKEDAGPWTEAVDEVVEGPPNEQFKLGERVVINSKSKAIFGAPGTVKGYTGTDYVWVDLQVSSSNFASGGTDRLFHYNDLTKDLAPKPETKPVDEKKELLDTIVSFLEAKGKESMAAWWKAHGSNVDTDAIKQWANVWMDTGGRNKK